MHGLRDGLPIALGYLAVSFSLGIIAAKAGLTAWEGSSAVSSPAPQPESMALIRSWRPMRHTRRLWRWGW